MLKKRFGKSKKLQTKVVPASNFYSNRFDDFINSSKKKTVIWQSVRNTLNPWAQSAKSDIKFLSDSKLEKEMIKDLIKNKSILVFLYRELENLTDKIRKKQVTTTSKKE